MNKQCIKCGAEITNIEWDSLDELIRCQSCETRYKIVRLSVDDIGLQLHNPELILYIDLDGCAVNYDKAKDLTTYDQRQQQGFFEMLEPFDDAIDSIKYLDKYFNIYFLSTAPWSNVHSWTEKRLWVEKHLGDLAFKKLILSHNKGLLKGNFIIDDRTVNGVKDFQGYHIHFGTKDYPNWQSVVEFLMMYKNNTYKNVLV